MGATGNPLYLSNANEYSSNEIYNYDPCDCTISSTAEYNCVNTTKACDQVYGVQSSFWSTKYDASNLENSLFPRLLANAERAWSPRALGWYTNTSSQTMGGMAPTSVR